MDREIKAEQNATVLETARDNGIYIPTLCYNESLGPEGRCRLCMVEIKQGKPDPPGHFLPLPGRGGA